MLAPARTAGAAIPVKMPKKKKSRIQILLNAYQQIERHDFLSCVTALFQGADSCISQHRGDRAIQLQMIRRGQRAELQMGSAGRGFKGGGKICPIGIAHRTP
jgi:hypothetical protein